MNAEGNPALCAVGGWHRYMVGQVPDLAAEGHVLLLRMTLLEQPQIMTLLAAG